MSIGPPATYVCTFRGSLIPVSDQAELVSSSVVVTTSDLSRRFRGRVALDSVEVSWSTGVVGLLGANGAGKTTLLRILAGDLRPTRGAVRADRRAVAYLPQHPTWPGGFTARELCQYSAWWRGVPRTQRTSAVAEALAAVNLDRVDEPLRRLSGGMRQRAYIAQALVAQPALLLLDEPTVGLDPRQRAELRSAIRRIGERSCVVFSTHIVEDVEAAAEWVCVLDYGVVLFDGRKEDMVRATRPAQGQTALERAYLDLVHG